MTILNGSATQGILMIQEMRSALTLLVLSILVMGLGYPFLMNSIGATFFPHQASGSMVEKDGKIIGSELIGQNFTGNGYFHPRPSAAGSGYDASNSAGSNLAPSDLNLIKTITARVNDLRQNGDSRSIPIDMVTSSGSGLDPDISVANAQFQAPRIAQARNLSLLQIETLITEHTSARFWGLFGEKHINVLALNMALDQIPVAAPSAP